MTSALLWMLAAIPLAIGALWGIACVVGIFVVVMLEFGSVMFGGGE